MIAFTSTICIKMEGFAVSVDRPFDPGEAQLGDGFSMLVVERPSKSTYSVAEIKTADAVQEQLVDPAVSTDLNS